jgi:hypothetical protein
MVQYEQTGFEKIAIEVLAHLRLKTHHENSNA